MTGTDVVVSNNATDGYVGAGIDCGYSTLDLTAMYIDIDNGYDAFSLDNTRHTR